MSPSIWTRCGGRSSAREIRCEPWRVVESQRIASTRPLVDTDAEHEVLERLIDDAKPTLRSGPDFLVAPLPSLLALPVPAARSRVPVRPAARTEPLVRGRGLAHLARGGRVLSPPVLRGDGGRARTAHHADVGLPGAGSHPCRGRPPGTRIQAVRRQDLFADHLRHEPAARVRDAGQRHPSRALPLRRDPDGKPNVGLFSPSAFASRRPMKTPETWHCTITASHDVEFRHEGIARIETVPFPRQRFLVKGVLPAPAT